MKSLNSPEVLEEANDDFRWLMLLLSVMLLFLLLSLLSERYLRGMGTRSYVSAPTSPLLLTSDWSSALKMSINS